MSSDLTVSLEVQSLHNTVVLLSAGRLTAVPLIMLYGTIKLTK